MPFPRDDFREVAKSVQAIGTFDRNCQPGFGGNSYIQVRHSLYDEKHVPVAGFVGGLSGKEVTVDNFVKIGEKTLEYAKSGKPDAHPIWV